MDLTKMEKPDGRPSRDVPSSLLAVSIGTVLWLVISGENLFQALGALLVLWVVGGIGVQFLALGGVLERRPSDMWQWRFGPGVVLGIFLLYWLRALTSREILIGCVSVFASFEIFSSVRVQTRSARVDFAQYRHWDFQIVLIRKILCVMLVIGIWLAKSWPWVLPTSIGLACLLAATYRWTSNRAVNRFVSSSLSTAAVTSVFLAFRTRADLWWILADDFQWFDSKRWSLINLGPKIDAASQAQDTLASISYHNGAYFLAGLIDLVASGQSFHSLTRLLPVSIALVIGCCASVFFQTVSHWFGFESLVERYLAIVLVVLLVPISPESPSNALGMSAFLATTALACKLTNLQDSWRVALVAAAFIPATLLSKAPFAYGSVTVLFLVYVAEFRDKLKGILMLALVSGSFFAFLSKASPHSEDFRVSFFDSASLFELADGSSPVKVLALISVLASIAPGLLLACHMFIVIRNKGPRVASLSLFLVLATGFMLRFVLGGRIETIRYFWLPAVIASALSSALWLGRSSRIVGNSKTNKLTLVASSLLISLLLLLLPMFIPNLNSGSIVAKTLRVARSPDFVQLTIAVVVGSYIVFGFFNSKFPVLRMRSSSSVGTMAIPVLLIATTLVSVANQVPDFFQNFEEARSGEADAVRQEWVGSIELVEAAEFLRTRTDPLSLAALTTCEFGKVGCPLDSGSFLSFAERRFLTVWFPYWASNSLELRDFERSTVTVLNPLADVIAYWKLRGVDYGVVDKSTIPELRDITMTQDIVFENSRFQILHLKNNQLD